MFLAWGVPYPIFCMNLLCWVKLGYPPNFNFLGIPLLGEKYVEGRKKEERKKKEIKKKNNAKFSGHYICLAHKTCVRMHFVRTKCWFFLEGDFIWGEGK